MGNVNHHTQVQIYPFVKNDLDLSLALKLGIPRRGISPLKLPNISFQRTLVTKNPRTQIGLVALK